MDSALPPVFISLIKLDDELYDLSQRKAAHQEEIKNLLSKEKAAQQLVNEQINNIHDLKKQAHTKELEIKSLDATRSDKQKKLANLFNPKEFMSLQQELEILEQKRSQADEDLFKLWSEIDSVQVSFQKIKKEQERYIENFKEEIKNKEMFLENITRQINEIQEERDIQSRHVPRELYEKYESMGKALKRPAVAIKNDSCSYCFYALSTQDLSAVRNNQFRQCSDCFRILYNKT